MFKKLAILIIGLGYLVPVYSDYSQDSGSISEFFTNPDGAVAIILNNGFPQAQASNQCPGNNGYAGIAANASAILKASLLTAKVTNANVVITIEGCNGGWLNLKDVYLK